MPQHKAIKMAIAHFQGGDECILSSKRLPICCIRMRYGEREAGARVEMQKPGFWPGDLQVSISE